MKKNQGDAAYLLATTNYATAALYIVDGEKVITLNGFSGSDQVYTAESLQSLVAAGKVKYFLISGGGMGGGGRGGPGGNTELTQWITQHGTQIPSSEWQSADSAAASVSMQGGRGESMILYEVKL